MARAATQEEIFEAESLMRMMDKYFPNSGPRPRFFYDHVAEHDKALARAMEREWIRRAMDSDSR